MYQVQLLTINVLNIPGALFSWGLVLGFGFLIFFFGAVNKHFLHKMSHLGLMLYQYLKIVLLSSYSESCW